MPQPNMKKEYRAELRDVRKTLRQLQSLSRKNHKDRGKQLRAVDREYYKNQRAILRRSDNLQKRKAILEGRLS